LAKRLINNELEFWVSDSTSVLKIVDPFTWKVKNQITVKNCQGRAVKYVNDMIFAKGKLYANIFLSEKIIKIDPDTGNIEG
jgi:glutamine cyclotransferase